MTEQARMQWWKRLLLDGTLVQDSGKELKPYSLDEFVEFSRLVSKLDYETMLYFWRHDGESDAEHEVLRALENRPFQDLLLLAGEQVEQEQSAAAAKRSAE